jgi:hypothetical protein
MSWRLSKDWKKNNTLLLSSANFVGYVVGFLNVLPIRLRSLLFAESDPLKAQWY